MIVMTYQTYKTARDNGRNGGLWALATLGVGIALQFVIPLIIGVVLGIILVMQGTSDPVELQSKIIGPANIFGIVCLVLSIVGMWLIFKHVSKVPGVPIAEVPPPPPEFG
jgi:hypothetical protein